VCLVDVPKPQIPLAQYLQSVFQGRVDFSQLVSSPESRLTDETETLSENWLGQLFSFQSQETARSLYIGHLFSQYQIWSFASASADIDPLKIVSFPVCCGAGGIGKTTFVRKSLRKELAKPSFVYSDHLRALLQSCFLSQTEGQELIFRISFSDDPLTADERSENRNLQQSIALRLLHQLFKFQGGQAVRFETFVIQLDESWKHHISLRDVIEFIRSYVGISIGAHCLMVLHLDDTNQLLETTYGMRYLRDCIQFLVGYIWSEKSTFLFCPLTGTISFSLNIK
jgi:hypothetical protein